MKHLLILAAVAFTAVSCQSTSPSSCTKCSSADAKCATKDCSKCSASCAKPCCAKKK